MTAPRGVPEERTALAWQRTGLGMLGVAALVAHSAVRHAEPALVALAGIAALLGLGVLGGLAPLRYRQVRRRLAADESTAEPRMVTAASAAVGLVGVAAVVAIGLAH